MPVEKDVEIELDGYIEDMRATAIISYLAEHAPYVNYDTEWTSKKPPIEPLKGWARRVLNDESAAWAIQQKLFEEGDEGVFYAERSIEHGKNAASQVVGRYEGTDDPKAYLGAVEDLADVTFGHSQDIVAEEATDRGTLLQSGQVDVRDGEVVREGDDLEMEADV